MQLRRLRTLLRSWVPLLTAWSAIFIAAGCTLPKQPTNSHSPLRLEDDQLSIVLDEESKGGIRSISAFAGGAVLGSESTPTLFSFVLRGEKERVYDNRRSDRFTWSRNEQPNQLTLHYQGFEGINIDVTVFVEITDLPGESRWKIQIENQSGQTISTVRFPWIQGYRGLRDKPEHDVVLLPIGEGRLIENPLRRIGKDEMNLGTWYPGNHSMQFMGLYSQEETGFYLACEDTGGLTKRLGLFREATESAPESNTESTPESNHETELTAGVEFLLPESNNNAFQPDFDVVLKPLRGSWYAYAAEYRSWAARQWWAAKKISQRVDIPAWFREGRPIITIENYATTGGTGPEHRRRSLKEVVGWEKRYGDAIGPATFFWSGWERGGAWVSPDLFPPIEGEAAFAEAVRQTKELGHRLEAYFSTPLYITEHGKTTDRIEKHGLAHAVTKKNGEKHRFTNWWGPSTKMCLATDWWQAVIEDTVTGLAERGFDLIQLDMFPISSPQPCWDAAHPHSLGAGEWCFEAARKLLRRARDAGRRVNPKLAFSIELPCELYIPYIDTHLSRDDWRDMVAPEKREVYTEVPLFSYVYHEYITTQGYEWAMMPLRTMANTIAMQIARGKIPTGCECYGAWDPEWQPPSASERSQNRARVEPAEEDDRRNHGIRARRHPGRPFAPASRV